MRALAAGSSSISEPTGTFSSCVSHVSCSTIPLLPLLIRAPVASTPHTHSAFVRQGLGRREGRGRLRACRRGVLGHRPGWATTV